MFAILLFLTLKASVETGKSRKRRLLIRGLCLLADILGIFVLPPIVGKTDFQLFADNIKTSSFSAYYADIVSPKYPFVTGDLFLIAAYVSKSAEAAEIMEAKELPQGVVFRPDTITAISKLIVIVGESARRENHSLYGYPLKTTPFLDSLALQKERLSYFGSVISPSSFTREVLRMTFSFATPSNSDLFLEYANLVRMAKDAGYKTSWISTQNSLGWYNSVMNLIANVADSRYFHEGDDLELIPYIKASIEKGQRQFIVVHINGSHWPYYRFDGDDTKALGTSDEVADYNKTIHHTDRLLREIYRIAGTLDENVLLYYYSDHGEVVGENGAAGHGIPDRYKIQYHVPLVVMQNHPFICADSIVNKYYDGQTGRLNISSNIYILGELMGYHVSDSLIEQSKIDGRYIRQGDASYMLYEKIKD
jgi:glucan phosphoethanolaminetransferase (alkaline phosphatase superfamily)